jgi:uncharacterized damage-inducible protein DinB
MKKNITIGFFILSFLFIVTLQLKAQNLSSEDIKSQLVKEWQRAKEFTVEYLNAMPADKYSFVATDSIRSFAQQMLHLAGGNVFLMMNATDQKPPAAFSNRNMENSPGAQKKDSLMYYVTTSYDYCIDAVKNTDVGKWGEKKKIFGFEETRFALIIKTFEHQTHHRGQTTIYIRELKLRPPGERLF